MISDKYKCIFIHIPKSGGSTIEHLIDTNVGLDIKTNGKSTGNTEFKDKHYPLSYYKNEFPDKYKLYFKFTFVRNPWEKIFSYYNWTIFLSGKNQPEKNNFKTWAINFFKNKDFHTCCLDHMLGPDYINELDFIGRFENFEDDIVHVCKTLDINFDTIPCKNKINKYCYKDYYDDELKNIVEKNHKKEIDIFNYKF